MNKIINKFLKSSVQDKHILLNYLNGSDTTAKLLSAITTDNYYDMSGLIDGCKYKHSIEEFVSKNRENILLLDLGKKFMEGVYIHPLGNFAMRFSRYDRNKYEDLDEEEIDEIEYKYKIKYDFDFITKKSGEKTLLKFIKDNFCIHKEEDDLTISLLQEERGSYYLKKYPVFPIIDLNIEDNYNDDFSRIDEKLVDILMDQKKSFSILHRLPGTGKTTYIKNLCYRLTKQKKEVVYLPPSITHMLASPSFIGNLDLFKDKILVIEDAESILLDQGSRSQAVANILNITDGILSDIYNIHFIFTFNMDIRKIDQALLRKGRLSLKYEFKELTKDKVEKLAKKLNITAPKSGTLAEVYNQEENGTETNLNTKLGY